MLAAIRQYILREILKQRPKGIVTALPNKDLVEMNVQVTAQFLMQNGVDPRTLKNANQVENAIKSIENRPKVQEGIKSTPEAKVFDMEGKRIKNTKNIMGGKEIPDDDLPPPGSRGGDDDISAPIQSEDEVLEKLNEQNKEARRNLQIKLSKDKEYQKFKGETEEEIRKRFGLDDPEDMAQGGRAGFKTGLGKRFLDLLKGKPKLKFDEDRFRKGPIDLDFLENIDKSDLEKFIRTRDTGGVGGYGMYDNFKDMPAGLRAAELIKTIKTKDGGINYKAAELFLGKKLKGNESADELIQILNRQEMRADGGRIGFKEGMSRRTFLKLLGGLAAVPIIGKFIKPMKVGKKIANVPIIKTDNVPGKPEWFDALVNKVIIEGDDVTKRFATKEREIVHAKQIDEDNYVTVTQDLDECVVRVEYENPKATMFGDKVDLTYKKPLPDEGDPRPVGEFQTAESGIVGRAQGPDDYDLEIEGMSGRAIEDLESDVSALKQYATGEKPTLKEIVQNKKRRDKVEYYESPEGQSQYVIERQGEYDYSPDDGMASGGIARLLGE